MASHDELVKQMIADHDALQEKLKQLPDETIIRNSIQTPDGTEIVSTHRHDFSSHTDENGKSYSVDGGTAYLRRVGEIEDCIDTSVMLYHGHEVVREAFTWGTRGPQGDQPLTRIALCDMTEGHIQAIINDGYNVWPLMEAELSWRESAAARKRVRLNDIERLQRMIELRPDRQDQYAQLLEPIIERFNSNEFN